MLRHFQRILDKFPFSKLSTVEPTLRIYPVSYAETPVLEAAFPNPPEPERILASAREFQNPDCCFLVEAFWDLWRWDGDWALRPARVILACFGPEFDSERGETVRIEFGLEEQFLPTGDRESMAMIRANIQSLLRLVHDLDDSLPVERRQLWSESGENFADKLQAALAATQPLS